ANVSPKAIIHRLKEELCSFFLYDFVAPKIYVHELSKYYDESLLPIPRYACDRVCRTSLMAAGKSSLINRHPPHLTFETPDSLPRFSPGGWMPAVVWLILLGVAISNLVIGRAMSSRLVLGVAGAIAFNALLHLIYGDDMFLYSAHYTFLVLSLIVLGLR